MSIFEWRGWRNSPLLFLIILPFYSLPGGDIRIVQMQMFQLAAIGSLLFTKRTERTPVLNPFCLLAIYSVIQLALVPSGTRLVFFVQMILLAYLIFDSVYSARISFKALRKVVMFFVLVTALFSFDQLFKLGLPLPGYLVPDKSASVSGIWTGTAYCGAFCAFSIPFILSFKGRLKWAFLATAGFVIFKTYSSFAMAASLASVFGYLFFKNKKQFKRLVIPSLALSAAVYWFVQKGDASGEMQRFFIWSKTWESFLKEPFFGHGFGAFLPFSTGHIFTYAGTKGILFPHAHNEYLQMLQEGGIVGFSILMLVVIRVVLITIKHSYSNSVFALGMSLVSVFLICFGQSLFHTPSIAIFAIFAYAVFETEIRKERMRNDY